MAATLIDVAQAAGVSIATASRAFNYPDRVAVQTRERILSAAEELNYQPSGPVASTRSSGLVFAVIVAEMFNPVFGQFLGAIEEQIWQAGHRLLVASSAQDPRREQEAIAALRPHADGIILLSPRSTAEEICHYAGDTPVVVSNGAASSSWPTVLMAADSGIGQAMEHLSALGHQHVAFAPGSATSWANQDRLDAMKRHCRARGLRLTVVGNQAPTVQGGLSAAAAVAASGATAVVGYNDFVALGLLAGLRPLGFSCPKDISIIGIDDGDFALVSQPPLTSITSGVHQIASRAYSLLRTMIVESSTVGRVEVGESQLIVRESTGRAPAADAGRPLAGSQSVKSSAESVLAEPSGRTRS